MPALVAAIPSSLPTVIKRISEAAGILAGLLYALGVLRITGELRVLHLSTPTVLSGFAHTDVLMKGVGVFASQLSSTLIMLTALALYASPALLHKLNRVLLDERALRRHELFVAIVVGVGLVLASRFWEGAAFALIALVWVGYLEVRNRPATRSMALAVVLLGMLFTGVIGSYFHAPPLMHASVIRPEQPTVRGLLVGKGTDGEWYVATQTKDSYELDVIGGATEKATRVIIEPADDRDYRTLYYQVVDQWQS